MGEYTRKDSVKIAIVQIDPQIGEVENNRGKVFRLAVECAEQGAKIIVFPELCTSGCMLESRSETYAVSEKIPDGLTTRGLAEIAAQYGAYIVAGIPEIDEDGVSCFNSAVLVGPKGYVGKHRKHNLWDVDKAFFEPGNLGYQVFSTEYGRIGIMICYDMWFPENYRILAAMGADLICCPTNWMELDPTHPGTMGIHMAMAGAGANHIYVAAADRVGKERGITYCGGSALLGPVGWPEGEPCSFDKEEILYAEVDLLKAREVYGNLYNGNFSDRRLDLYDRTLGYKL